MRRQRGFTFIELLFALFVLTIVITTTLAMFAERSRRLQLATETILAYQALSNEAEVRRRLPIGELDTLGNNFMTDTTILTPLAPFRTVVLVTDLRPGVKKLSLIIRWKWQKGTKDREARLDLLRADTGGTNLW